MHDPILSHNTLPHDHSSGEAMYSILESHHEQGRSGLDSGMDGSFDPSRMHHPDLTYNPSADPYNSHYIPAIDPYVTTDQALHQVTANDPQFGSLLGQVNQLTSESQDLLHQVQNDPHSHVTAHSRADQTPAHFHGPSPDSSMNSFVAHLNNQVNETLSPHIPTSTELHDLYRLSNVEAALAEQRRIDASNYINTEASFNITNIQQDAATAQNEASSTADDVAWASWDTANQINNAWWEN